MEKLILCQRQNIGFLAEKSRSDDTSLSIPTEKMPSLRDFGVRSLRPLRRLKPPVNKISSLRDFVTSKLVRQFAIDATLACKVCFVFGTIIMAMTFVACSDDKQNNYEPQMDCTELAKNIVNNDIEALRKQIDGYFSQLTPNKPTKEDMYGNADHFNRFVTDLEQCSTGISIIYACYDCIKTLPPIPEIKVKAIYQNQEIEKAIDLYLREGEVLKFSGLHE